MDGKANDLVDGRRRSAEGSPVHVTIVFIDIVGSTDELARLAQADWRHALDEARDRLDPQIEFIKGVIHEFGGTVARVQGDGVLAIFGGLKAIENHAVNACGAALKVRDHFRDRAARLGGGEFTAVRIGMHSGLILARVQTNDFGSDLDILGLPANRAKKVEEEAEPNTILLTREALDIAGAAVDARHSAGDLYELTGLVLHHDLNRQFSQDRLETFVGRREILDRLIAGVGAALEHKAKSVCLVGEAGVGKSRLLFELSRTAEALGFRVLELRGHAIHTLAPFAPLKSFVARLLRLDTDEETLAARRLPARIEQAIVELTGGVTNGEWGALDGGARRKAIIEAVCILAAQAARRKPLLVIADDAHDFDAETLDAVAGLKTLSADLPLAMVATARNVARHVVRSIADEIVDLDTLTEEQSLQFARSAAVGTGIAEDDMVHAVRSAAGNPLFLQALIRELRRGGKGDAAPANITSLVQTRMSRVSDGARSTLEVAAILRANFDKRMLAAAAGLDDASLDHALAELAGQDLVVSDAAGVRFCHDLFRAAVDELLTRRRRQELHRKAREALAPRPHSPELLERLALHAEMAGDHVDALGFLLQAVRLAVRSSALKTVRALYARAMRMKPQAPVNLVPSLVDVTVASIDALQQSGDLGAYRTALEFVIENSAGAAGRANEALARSHLALLCWMQARHDEGFRHAETALGIARELQSLPLRALAQPHLANIEHARGNLDRAIALHAEIVEALEGEHEASTLRPYDHPERPLARLSCVVSDRTRALRGRESAPRPCRRGPARARSAVLAHPGGRGTRAFGASLGARPRGDRAAGARARKLPCAPVVRDGTVCVGMVGDGAGRNGRA
jgi:class 3 adenylate cyclase